MEIGNRLRRVASGAAIVAVGAGLALAGTTAVQAGTGYTETKLTSNQSGVAPNQDAHLLNPWGIVAGPTTPFWVSDNHSGLSTVYNTSGAKQSLEVTIPGTTTCQANPQGSPTGIVFNGTNDFSVTANKKTGVSKFIFASEDGGIFGWSPTVDATNAITAVDNCDGGSEYKGLAMGVDAGANFLYAADFGQTTGTGGVAVFDKNFASKPGFTDATLPVGYAPFNVAEIGGQLFVAFALNNGSGDDSSGAGHGFVDVFTTHGVFVKHLISNGQLNSPWGIALAPSSFGDLGGDLLVGNFGDGKINAFDPSTGTFRGTVSDASGNPIVNPGLWGLTFGNGGNGGTTGTLYLTAGPNGEADGLLAAIAPNAVAAAAAATPALPRAGAVPGGSLPLPLLGGLALAGVIGAGAVAFRVRRSA